MSGYSSQKHALRWRILALVFVVGLLCLSGSGLADAATSTPAINQATAEAQALSDLIDQLNTKLEALTEDYNYAEQQFEDTQAAAQKTAAELAQAEKDMAAAQDQYNQRLVNIYKNGRLGTLDVVLGAGSFSELVTRIDELTLVSEQDAQLVQQIKSYGTQKATVKAKLDAQLQQQKDYQQQTAAAKQKVLGQLEQQKNALKGKEALIAQLKKAEAARQAKLAAEERARRIFLASRPGKVVSMAMKFLGVPYVWGGSSPNGFDCSGLVQYVYARVGVSLPHSSRMQFTYGKPVAPGQMQAGDLVFFFTPIQHVGIYLGNGRMINATGNEVQISDVWPSTFRGARRVL